jgi:hypothetical protein
MQRRRSDEIGLLLSSHGYTRHDQLPEIFVRGLRTAPWHDARDYPGFSAVEAALNQVWHLLRDEYMELVAKNLTEPDYECIHAAFRGSWMRFSVNTPWQDTYVMAGWLVKP